METMKQIHISHTPAADPSSAKLQEEWLARLSDALRNRLEELLGEPVAITTQRSTSSTTDAPFSAVICVVTPELLHSETSRRDLRQMIAETDANAPVAQGRIIPVTIGLLPVELLPPELAGCRVYDFSASWSGADNGHATARPRYDKVFWLAVDDLAFALRDAMTTSSTKSILFLAEPSPDLVEDHARLRRELQRHGHRLRSVAPMADRRRFEEMTRREIAGSSVAVHMIGAAGGTGSLTGGGWEMQLGIAAGQGRRSSDFMQILWFPPWLDHSDEVVDRLVEDLRRSEEGRDGIEVVQTSLEDLKTIVFDALERGANVEAHSSDDATNPERHRRIYLIHDRRDRSAVEPLAEHFKQRGLDVLLPIEEQDHALLRERHFTNLRSCDAALIFYGAVNEQWVRMKQQDLKKAAGYGRTGAMLGAVYIGGEPTLGKQRFQANDLTVIRQFGEFVPTAVGGFVRQLQQGVTESEG